MIANSAKRARRALAACLLGLLVAPAVPAQSAPPRPYKANLAVTITYMKESPTEILFVYAGIGNGTHVGHYEEHGFYVVNKATSKLAGAACVTASDGSTFELSLVGKVTGPDTLAGTAVVLGGTGRFLGVKGALAFAAMQTASGLVASVAGWIQY